MFRYPRRVQFAETDLAGLVHFTHFFRYMEEAEHALWRAAGLTIGRAGARTGWPRLSATCDFRAPLRFEDEVEVRVTLAQVTRRSLQYEFTIVCGDVVVAVGAITTAYVSKGEDGAMKALDLPADIVEKLRRAAD